MAKIKTVWLTEPKRVIIWPFTEKFANLWTGHIRLRREDIKV